MHVITSEDPSQSACAFLLPLQEAFCLDKGVFGKEGKGHLRISYSCSTEELLSRG